MKKNNAPEFIDMVEKEKEKSNRAIAATVPQFKVGNFTEVVEIGDGGEGRVYIANSSQLGQVALKILKRKVLLKGFSQEIELLSTIRHPHIVQLFGIILDDYNITNGFVMEFMKLGSLYKVIHDPSIKYEKEQIYSWINQASLGLQYLHDRELLHRDIKPQNMLLGYSFDHLKLADFGLAKETTAASITGGVGTVLYMAPEVIQATRYAASADVYSLTVSIWEMVHRRRPFHEEQNVSEFKIAADVRNGRRPVVDLLIVDSEMESLLLKGWHEDPYKRLTVAEITIISKGKQETNLPAALHVPANGGTSASSLIHRSQNSVLATFDISEDTMKREKKNVALRAAGILLILIALGIGMWITVTKIQKQGEGTTKKFDKVEEGPSKAQEKKMEVVEALTLQAAVAKTEETILLMGGVNRGDRDEMFVFDRNISEWKSLPLTLPCTGSYGSSFYLKGDIYVFGYKGWEKTLYKLDTRQMKWIAMAEMNEARYGTRGSSLIFEGCIWVFGGSNGWKALRGVEKYCPEINRWIRMPAMPTARQTAAVAVHNGKILISGGRGPKDSSVPLKTADSLDPISNTWSSLPDLPAPRIHHSMISFQNRLIILGGYEVEFEHFDTVWSLNVEENNTTWKELPPMQEVRQAESVAILDNELYVLGGQNQGAFETVEIFDGRFWRFGPDLRLGGWAITSVVIPYQLIDNMSRYQPPEDKLEPAELLEFQSLANQSNQTILVIGGRNKEEDLDELLVFDANTIQWRTLSLKLPHTIAYGGSAYLEGEIYIFGGDGLGKKMYKLDIDQMKWIEKAEMLESRENIMSNSAVFQGCIWVFGGWNGAISLITGEKYCPEVGKWELVGNIMSARRSNAAAVVHKGQIVISGGVVGSLRSVESFNTKSNTWSPLLDLPAPRICHSMVSVGDSLIVLGGYKRRFKASNSVWNVRPEEKNTSWKALPSMEEPRHSLSAVVLGDEIFVIGGADDINASKTVEIFDGKTWKFGPTLPSARWGISSVVIPNQLADLLLNYPNKVT